MLRRYRLFYFKSGTSNNIQGGVIGTFKISSTGAGVYEWSTTKGIPAKIAHAGVDENGSEVLFHASEDGRVYSHDSGNSFDSSNIVATYKSPDLDYGDAGIRKSMQRVNLNWKPEGEVSANMFLQFYYEWKLNPRCSSSTENFVNLVLFNQYSDNRIKCNFNHCF